MTGVPSSRPLVVKVAIATFLVDMGLSFMDAFRYQYTVSPDYFDLFWSIAVPIFLVGLVRGLLALLRGRLLVALVAPVIMTVVAFLSIDRTPPSYRPLGWPTPIPQWVHLTFMALLVYLMLSASSRAWYGRRSGTGA